ATLPTARPATRAPRLRKAGSYPPDSRPFKLRHCPAVLLRLQAMSIIRAEKISKCFRIYRHPSDHLKELLTFGRRRYHEPFWAVRDVDVEIDRGCCLGVIG